MLVQVLGEQLEGGAARQLQVEVESVFLEDYNGLLSSGIRSERRTAYRAICAHDILDVAGVFTGFVGTGACVATAGDATAEPFAVVSPHAEGVLEPHAAVVDAASD